MYQRTCFGSYETKGCYANQGRAPVRVLKLRHREKLIKVHTYAAWSLNLVDRCAGLIMAEEKAFVLQYKLKQQNGKFANYRKESMDLLLRSKKLNKEIEALKKGISTCYSSVPECNQFMCTIVWVVNSNWRLM